MVSRNVTGAILRTCFAAVRRESTPSRILAWTLDELAVVQRDLDKTGDVDSAEYYAGMVDAFHMVANWIAPLKLDKEAEFFEMLGKVYNNQQGEQS